MTTIMPPSVSAVVALGPVSQILPAQYRFAGDDWDDEAAFLFTFYTALPTFDANGNVLTAGAVRDLTGCTFSGTVAYRPRPVSTYPESGQFSDGSQSMVGTVIIASGQTKLTLSSIMAGYPRQDPSLWTPDVPGFEAGALLEVRGRLTDPLSKTSTQGIIPLFVF